MSTSFPFNHWRVRFSGETDVGRKRDHNEDYFFLPDEEMIGIVADGMGGHACGEVASEMAVETVIKYFRDTSDDPEVTWPFKVGHGRHNENRMATSVMLANQLIYEGGQNVEGQKGMGTTIVVILFDDDYAMLAHVGDSRIYRLRERDREIVQLTEDHAFVTDYARMKGISIQEAAETVHQSNVVSRALGMKDKVKVDVQRVAPGLGDIFLLCTDGLTDMVTDEEILEITLAQPNLDRACDDLIEAANRAGGKDNITVILARIEPQG
ncbi:MAG: Stp1/IreP family PP2C-type Ser/Thr phosphatase [bacterium]